MNTWCSLHYICLQETTEQVVQFGHKEFEGWIFDGHHRSSLCVLYDQNLWRAGFCCGPTKKEIQNSFEALSWFPLSSTFTITSFFLILQQWSVSGLWIRMTFTFLRWHWSLFSHQIIQSWRGGLCFNSWHALDPRYKVVGPPRPPNLSLKVSDTIFNNYVILCESDAY